jgi:hypothetical protein
MSYLIAVPDMLRTAAADVAGIGSSLKTFNAEAATQTMFFFRNMAYL